MNKEESRATKALSKEYITLIVFTSLGLPTIEPWIVSISIIAGIMLPKNITRALKKSVFLNPIAFFSIGNLNNSHCFFKTKRIKLIDTTLIESSIAA